MIPRGLLRRHGTWLLGAGLLALLVSSGQTRRMSPRPPELTTPLVGIYRSVGPDGAGRGGAILLEQGGRWRFLPGETRDPLPDVPWEGRWRAEKGGALSLMAVEGVEQQGAWSPEAIEILWTNEVLEMWRLLLAGASEDPEPFPGSRSERYVWVGRAPPMPLRNRAPTRIAETVAQRMLIRALGGIRP